MSGTRPKSSRAKPSQPRTDPSGLTVTGQARPKTTSTTSPGSKPASQRGPQSPADSGRPSLLVRTSRLGQPDESARVMTGGRRSHHQPTAAGSRGMRSKPVKASTPSPSSSSAGSGGSSGRGSKAVVPRGRRPISSPLADLANPDKRIAMTKRGGLLCPEGYSMRPIIPAEKAELVSVARAMNREEFGPRLKTLFQPETEAATEAIQSGVYIGWRCPEFTWDCIRVGRESRCFCGHILSEHAPYNGRSVRVPCRHCPCKAFAFIPGRPEDIGEFWFQRRRDFDPTTWRAKCRCKHTHEDHDPAGMRRCRMRSCGCGAFNSNFLCAACDRHWEDHETVFETESERHEKKIPYGEDYLPFAEMPDLRNMALTGVDSNPGVYRDLVEGQGNIPRGQRAIGQDVPVRPPTKSGFNPVWD